VAIDVPAGIPELVNGMPTDSPAVEGVTSVMILVPRTRWPVKVITAGPVHCVRAASEVASSKSSTMERMSKVDVPVMKLERQEEGRIIVRCGGGRSVVMA
jgi:hypothetical protein